MSVLSSRSSSQVRSFSPFRVAPVRSNQSGNVYGNITVHNSQQPSSKYRTGTVIEEAPLYRISLHSFCPWIFSSLE